METLQLQNQTARILIERDGEAEVERRLELYRGQLVRVEGLIPSSEELPELLDAISIEAQRAGVELSLIQPAEAVAEDYYTRRVYSLGVLGSYHEIGRFLTRVASLPRIITPANLSIVLREETTRTGDPLLEAMFTIETYVLPSFPDGYRPDQSDGASEASRRGSPRTGSEDPDLASEGTGTGRAAVTRSGSVTSDDGTVARSPDAAEPDRRGDAI